MRPHRRQPTRLPCPWDSPGKYTGVGCHFVLQWMKVKSESEVAQSCPTLSDSMVCSAPGSSVHGIFQARVWSGVPLPSPYWWLRGGKTQLDNSPQDDFYNTCKIHLWVVSLGNICFCVFELMTCFALLK